MDELWFDFLGHEHLMSMTFNLTGKSNAVTCVVAYGPTDTVSNTREQKDMFWADLESAVTRVPSSDYLFVLIDANARTGVSMGEEDCKVIGTYGRDTRVSDSNGTSLLRFAGDNKQACPRQHVLLRPQGMHVSYIQRYPARG